MKTTWTTLALILVATTVNAATIKFRSPATGNYRILAIDDIESSDGHLYDVMVREVTYEEFQQFHDFTHPLDVRLGFIAAVANAQIPLESVRIFPDPIYWIEQPWTERYDALYQVPYMVQCDTSCDPNEQTTLSVAGVEYNTLGVSFGDSWAVPYNLAIVSRQVPGDLTGEGVLDILDIDSLTRAAASGRHPADFDVNLDGLVNQDDIKTWIKDVYGTWIGDIDLNRQFNSSDLVNFLSKGTYEAGWTHAAWSDGDFSGDGTVDSSDLVFALSDGGYEVAAALPVPEPTTIFLFFVGVLSLLRGFRLSV